jgi:diaminohydroxyphosphoribosylaminopyrimidine deaminase/5-amino-6-(5-phosphoribosylamino)uracil reductase
VATPAEIDAMRRAVALAATGLGTTGRNPVVGAVVLDAAGAVVGEGAHVGGPGNPHAEVVALRQAGERARGGTAIVTLEPCDHTGTTGPCTRALLAAGVSRVVYAVADPTEEAAGGAQTLAAAGVAVEGGLLTAEAAAVNEAWLLASRELRPFVTWKFAATMDGRSQAADGTSRWITGPEARLDTHVLRGHADAVAVGVGTILGDDPLLTVRDAAGTPRERQPLRVVFDSAARVPATARVLGQGCLLVVGKDAPPPPYDVELLRVRRGADGRVDLREALAALYDRGLRHVFCEGGPRLAGGLLAADLVDRVVAYYAPALLGAGAPALGDCGVTTVSAARRLRIDEVTTVGDDVRIVARPAGRER